jgi:hypothetical protein
MNRASPLAAAAMPLARLHVIVTCTDRKTLRGPDSLRASSLPHAPLAERLIAWIQALETTTATQVMAAKLYSGDQWHVARGIEASAPSGVQVCMWVASAGYGLIRPESLLRPYAATFAAGHPDAVVPYGAVYSAADWWQGLASWQFVERGAPRTVAAIARLASANKHDFVLVAASESYVCAMMDDLRNAAQLLADRFALISIGLRASRLGSYDESTNYLMPGEARLRFKVGGATHSLNARLARRAVIEASEWLPSAERLRSVMQGWLDASPPAVRYARKRMSDESVTAYITEELRRNGRGTHTALLRALRASGRACEQARFAALFRETLSKTGSAAIQAGTGA